MKILMYSNALKLFYRANLVIVKESKITLSPIFKPVVNICSICKKGQKILFEIFITYFIHLKRELIKKYTRIFCINTFGCEVIKIRHYLFAHIPKEVINIAPFFFISSFSHAMRPA